MRGQEWREEHEDIQLVHDWPRRRRGVRCPGLLVRSRPGFQSAAQIRRVRVADAGVYADRHHLPDEQNRGKTSERSRMHQNVKLNFFLNNTEIKK